MAERCYPDYWLKEELCSECSMSTWKRRAALRLGRTLSRQVIKDELALGLASFAMVVTLEHVELDGVSLASIFNNDLFQSQEPSSQVLRWQMMTKPP
jgi:hypothetical protein